MPVTKQEWLRYLEGVIREAQNAQKRLRKLPDGEAVVVINFPVPPVVTPDTPETPLLASLTVSRGTVGVDGQIPFSVVPAPIGAPYAGGVWSTNKGTLTPSVTGTTARLLVSSLLEGETATVTYTVGGISDSETYQRPAVAPALLSASVDATGELLTLTFSKAVLGLTNSSFVLSGRDSLGGVSGAGTVWTYALPFPVYKTQERTLNSFGTSVVDALGTPLTPVLNFLVTNGSLVEIPVPDVPVEPDPDPPVEGVVQIKSITPQHNSSIIEWYPVEGAVDYRAYDPAHYHGGTHLYKYSGANTKIQLNGFNNALAQQPEYVVEALTTLGPYQRIDANMSHDDMTHINGQGPSTNNPAVIAISAPFRPTTSPEAWPSPGGTSLYRNTFDDTSAAATVFTKVTTPTLTALQEPLSEFYGRNIHHAMHTRVKSRDLMVDFLGHEPGTESCLIHQRHFMDVFLDGGGRNNNASSVLQPLVNGAPITFDLADGKIIHVTYEVDAFFGGRRWCEFQLKPAAETFLNPGKFFELRLPTESGRLIRWQTLREWQALDIFTGGTNAMNNTRYDQIPTASGVPNSLRDDPTLNIARTNPYSQEPIFNGTAKDIDFRHRLELYISKTKFAIYENGIKAIERDFTIALPFTLMQPAFVHQSYHTTNEVLADFYGSNYYIDITQGADERHWNAFGLEVVPSFPV